MLRISEKCGQTNFSTPILLSYLNILQQLCSSGRTFSYPKIIKIYLLLCYKIVSGRPTRRDV